MKSIIYGIIIWYTCRSESRCGCVGGALIYNLTRVSVTREARLTLTVVVESRLVKQALGIIRTECAACYNQQQQYTTHTNRECNSREYIRAEGTTVENTYEQRAQQYTIHTNRAHNSLQPAATVYNTYEQRAQQYTTHTSRAGSSLQPRTTVYNTHEQRTHQYTTHTNGGRTSIQYI